MKPQDMMTRNLLPRWLGAHRNWLKEFPRAKHIVTTDSGHEVILSDPELVINAVREMAESIHGQE